MSRTVDDDLYAAMLADQLKAWEVFKARDKAADLDARKAAEARLNGLHHVPDSGGQ